MAGCKGAPTRGDQRISVDEALHRLLPMLNPHDAVELITMAVRDNRARLFCDGVVVDPGFVRTHLVVEARLAVDGRWSAGIEATRSAPLYVHYFNGRWETRTLALCVLPTDKRQTEEQAKPFAKKAMERIPSSGDPYRPREA